MLSADLRRDRGPGVYTADRACVAFEGTLDVSEARDWQQTVFARPLDLCIEFLFERLEVPNPFLHPATKALGIS
jgi:hypothetical protein